MNRAPAGWGITGDVAAALVTERQRATRAKTELRQRSARIAYWLGRCGYVPSIEEILKTWNVSRATAYRWHAFAEAGGEQAVTAFKDPA